MLPYENSASWHDDYDDEDRYYAETEELESLATLMMDVETYDDYYHYIHHFTDQPTEN